MFLRLFCALLFYRARDLPPKFGLMHQMAVAFCQKGPLHVNMKVSLAPLLLIGLLPLTHGHLGEKSVPLRLLNHRWCLYAHLQALTHLGPGVSPLFYSLQEIKLKNSRPPRLWEPSNLIFIRNVEVLCFFKYKKEGPLLEDST